MNILELWVQQNLARFETQESVLLLAASDNLGIIGVGVFWLKTIAIGNTRTAPLHNPGKLINTTPDGVQILVNRSDKRKTLTILWPDQDYVKFQICGSDWVQIPDPDNPIDYC